MAIDYTLTPYPVVDLLSWHAGKALDLSPKFQRNPVWKIAARSQFVDTLLRGLPVPPIHIRLALGKTGRSERQVIDGQQRLRAVIDFVNGRFKISANIDSPWAGRSFESLEDPDRQNLMLARIYAYQYESLSDQDVLEIFSRLNKYSIALNPQELRNGKYFGQFISCSGQLSHESLEFWRDAKVFTEQSIARMQDIQLVSELLTMQMLGPQDKKTSLNILYARLDESWGRDDAAALPSQGEYLSRKESEQRFRTTLAHLAESVGPVLASTAFRRVPLFYSLYGAVYHRLYGLPGLATPTPRLPMSKATTGRLAESLEHLTEILSEKNADRLKGLDADFIRAASSQTDNVAPRRTRIEVIWKLSDLGA